MCKCDGSIKPFSLNECAVNAVRWLEPLIKLIYKSLLLYIPALVMLSACLDFGWKENKETVVTGPQESQSQPYDKVMSLVSSATAGRSEDCSVTVSGLLLLPRGTNISVKRYSGGSDHKLIDSVDAQVGADGKFSAVFPWKDGMYPAFGVNRVAINADFNYSSQSETVLSVVGNHGRNLPHRLLKPDDAEFPSEGGRLHELLDLKFPKMSSACRAIEGVRQSEITYRSTAQGTIQLDAAINKNADLSRIKLSKWTAVQQGGKWVVTLDAHDIEDKKATWEFEEATNKVKYLDPFSKFLSAY